MAAIGRSLLLRLRVKRRSLLQRYDDNVLHQLRVALRRLRSLLRHSGAEEADALRRELGQLAQATNAARDWDTLAIRARASLGSRKLRLVGPWLETGLSASHETVLALLLSEQWDAVMDRLESCIERGGLLPAGDHPARTEIDRGKQAVRRAWNKVLAEEERKHWHKLRLAIKELRYTFDSIPRDALEPSMKKTLKHCKRLQETLGDWHDAVVHMHMVRDYARGLDAEANGDLYDVLKNWSRQLEREAAGLLDEARAYVTGKGADLLPAAHGNGTVSP